MKKIIATSVVVLSVLSAVNCFAVPHGHGHRSKMMEESSVSNGQVADYEVTWVIKGYKIPIAIIGNLSLGFIAGVIYANWRRKRIA